MPYSWSDFDNDPRLGAAYRGLNTYYSGIVDAQRSGGMAPDYVRDLITSLVPYWALDEAAADVEDPQNQNPVTSDGQGNFHVQALDYPGGLCRTSGRMSQKGCRTRCGIDARGRMRKIRVNAAGEICPPRRMNPLNPQALSRSMRRMAGFRRFAVAFDRLVNRKLKPIHKAPSTRRGGGFCFKCRAPRSRCGC